MVLSRELQYSNLECRIAKENINFIGIDDRTTIKTAANETESIKKGSNR